MKAEELKKVVANHGAWLRGEGGERAVLEVADLRGVDLEGADLRGAILWGADLRGAILRGADLRGAILSDAVLKGAVLRGADITDAILPDYQIPEGDLVGWKCVDDRIVRLRIPPDARRTGSLVGRKCRAEFAWVVEIEDGEAEVVRPEGHIAGAGPETVYRVGEIVRPDSYDDDPRVECTHGVHFYLTQEEAE